MSDTYKNSQRKSQPKSISQANSLREYKHPYSSTGGRDSGLSGALRLNAIENFSDKKDIYNQSGIKNQSDSIFDKSGNSDFNRAATLTSAAEDMRGNQEADPTSMIKIRNEFQIPFEENDVGKGLINQD